MTPKRRRWLIALLLLGMCAAAALWWWARVPVFDAVQVRQGPLRQTVVATGRVDSAARLTLGSETVGTVAQVLVREGQQVAAGELLLRLRAHEAEAQVHKAQAELAQAQLQLRNLQVVDAPVSAQALQQAQAALQLARREHERTQALVAQGFLAQAHLDAAGNALAAAQAQLRSAQAQHAARQAGGTQQALAQARLQQAQAQLQQAQAQRQSLDIRAPADALVLARQVEPGDVVQAGRTLLELAQTGQTRIEASVDEKNLALLQLGMAAQAVADAYPGQGFAAELEHIAPGIDALRGTVGLRLHVPQPPPFLRPDMSVSVELLARQRPNALILPADAVQHSGQAHWVWRLQQGRAQRTPVTLGIQGIGQVQVSAGLQAGDWVLYPNAALREGQRAAVRSPSGERVAP